jgi:DNA-binding NarL/FixJ family response regulator
VPSVVFDVEPLWRNTLARMLERRHAVPVRVCESVGELREALTGEPPPRLLVADPGEGDTLEDFLHAVELAADDVATVVVANTRNGSWRRSLNEGGVVAFIPKEQQVTVIEESLGDAIEEHIPAARLTPRELEILDLVGMGWTNREIAAVLWLSDQTVKFHLANAYRRLGVRCRADAVAVAGRRSFASAQP